MNVTTVEVGVIAAVGVVAIAIYLAKRGLFDPSEEDESRDELRERQSREDWSIPARKRVKALPGPLRVLLVGMVVVTVIVSYGLYQYFRTGAPADSFLTTEVQFGAVAFVGVVLGIGLARWFDKRRRSLWVAYEGEGEEPQVGEIPVMTDDQEVRDGRQVVKELARNRLLGLFNRYRQVGERRELRSNQSLPSDRVEHLVPDHSINLPSGDFFVETQSEGDKVLSGGSSADLTYRSQNQMSYEESVTLRERMSRLRSRMRAVKATNAQLMDDIKKLRKEIENREYQEREALVEEIDEILTAMGPALQMANPGFQDNSQGPVQRAENGEVES